MELNPRTTLAGRHPASLPNAREGRKGTYMTRYTHPEHVANDFWDKDFGPDLDTLDAENHRMHELVESMPENDPEFARVTYGELDIAFESITQVDTSDGFDRAAAQDKIRQDLMAELAVW